MSNRCLSCSNAGDMVLTLKKQWFDMILSGVKKEEYRDIKPYWEKRFLRYFGQHYDFSTKVPTVVWNRQERTIVFRNGYGFDKLKFRVMEVEDASKCKV